MWAITLASPADFRQSPLFAVGVLLVCLLFGAFYILSMMAYRIRRKLRVQTKWECRDATVEDFPASYQPVFGAFTRKLVEFGFMAAANVCAMEMGKPQIIALFRNNGTGEMASISSWKAGLRYEWFVSIGSMFADGMEITTTDFVLQEFDRKAENVFVAIVPLEIGIEEIYRRHQAWVERVRPEGGEKVLPQPGEEMANEAQERTRMLSAKPGRYYPDPTGTFYKPTWREAFRLSVTNNPFFRPMVQWYCRRRTASIMEARLRRRARQRRLSEPRSVPSVGG
jgi:hypothetical protein